MTVNKKLAPMLRSAFPTRAIALLMAIGFVDLFVTAVLHANGMIVELNPLMKIFIEKSEWLFGIVKAGTLVAAWVALTSYSKVNLDFVRKASLTGSAIYISVWTAWFTLGRP